MIDLNAFVDPTHRSDYESARRVTVSDKWYTCRAIDVVSQESTRVLLVGESALLRPDLGDVIRHAAIRGVAVEVLVAVEDLTASRVLMLSQLGIDRIRILVKSGRHSTAHLHRLVRALPTLVPLDVHLVVGAQGWRDLRADLRALDVPGIHRIVVSGTGHRFDTAMSPWTAFEVARTLFEMVVYEAPTFAPLCVEAVDFSEDLLLDALEYVEVAPEDRVDAVLAGVTASQHHSALEPLAAK